MLSDKVRDMEQRYEIMRAALCKIAKLAEHHDPISDMCRKHIQHLAEEAASQGATS